LKYLEEFVGREKFDAFLNTYFNEFAFKSNYTEAFIPYLKDNLFYKNGLKPIPDLDEWIYGVGLPASLPEANSIRFTKVDQAVSAWEDDTISIDTIGWSSHEWVYFIKKLPVDLALTDMGKLDNAFHFTQSGNAEILGVWFVHCARTLYAPSFPEMEQFLVHTGRRKFLMPIYKELIKTDEGKILAQKIYKQARPNYHFVASNSLDGLVL
jgi:hypothetical protein